MPAEIIDHKLTKINLLGLGPAGLKAFFADLGEKPYRVNQILPWIYQQGLADFNLMTNLSKAFREKLSDIACIEAPSIHQEQVSSDGTRKWLLKLDAKNFIETVFIPEDNRGTLCISSQVGCSLQCSFCSTGTQGINRNLRVDEIIGQIWRAQAQLKLADESLKITNVVLMGMGEPLLNYPAVLQSLYIMRHDLAYALPKRRVTLSTSGLVPQIKQFSNDTDVALAISLHAPNDKLRNELVPINKKHPIKSLIEACKYYIQMHPKHHVLIEYVMLDGVNDSKALAKELIKVLSHLPCKINLIPFNPYPGSPYLRSKVDTILEFKDVLVQAGFITLIRKTRGDDIAAACGQLVGDIKDKTQRQANYVRDNLQGQAIPLQLLQENS